jgi:hypothetical protein
MKASLETAGLKEQIVGNRQEELLNRHSLGEEPVEKKIVEGHCTPGQMTHEAKRMQSAVPP